MRSVELLVEKYPALKTCLPDILEAYEILKDCFQRRGKLLVCGNGGSAADSEHIVGELMKGYLLKRPLLEDARQVLIDAFHDQGTYLADHLQGALPAISLSSQTAFLTAYANDVAADMVYAQQVYGYGVAGDVLLAISTSGNSKNVLHAVQVARAFGLRTIGLTGCMGGALAEVCEVAICVPAGRTPEVQEMHMAIYHALCALLEDAFFIGEAHKYSTPEPGL